MSFKRKIGLAVVGVMSAVFAVGQSFANVGTGATDVINNIDALGTGGLTVMNLLLQTTPGQIILVGIGFTILAIVLGGFFYLLSMARARAGR